MNTFQEQEEQRNIRRVAEKILSNTAGYSDGGWSNNTTGVPEEAHKDTFSMVLTPENCEGCAPEDVATKIKQILTSHLCTTDPIWKARSDEAKDAEAKPPKRRPLIEYELPECHSAEMGKLLRDLDQMIFIRPLFQDKLDSAYREAELYMTSQMEYDASTSGSHERVREYDEVTKNMPYSVVVQQYLMQSYRASRQLG